MTAYQVFQVFFTGGLMGLLIGLLIGTEWTSRIWMERLRRDGNDRT